MNSDGSSKPGKYGTLYLFLLRYRDKSDDGCPVFEERVWRYDHEHALRSFEEGNDEDSWLLISAAVAS